MMSSGKPCDWKRSRTVWRGVFSKVPFGQLSRRLPYTTLARALCHDERIQQAFDDGILWVTLGEKPDNLVGKVEDLIHILSGQKENFNGIDAASARLAELLADRDMLIVIDD